MRKIITLCFFTVVSICSYAQPRQVSIENMIDLNSKNITAINKITNNEFHAGLVQRNIFGSSIKDRILTECGNVYLIKQNQNQKSLVRINSLGQKDFEKNIHSQSHVYIQESLASDVLALTTLENGRIKQNSIIKDNQEVLLESKSVLRVSKSGNYIFLSNDSYGVTNPQDGILDIKGMPAEFQIINIIDTDNSKKYTTQLNITEDDLAIVRWNRIIDGEKRSSIILYSIPEKKIIHEINLIINDEELYDPLFGRIIKRGDKLFIPALKLQNPLQAGSAPYLLIFNLKNLSLEEIELTPFKNIMGSNDGKEYLVTYWDNNKKANRHVIYDANDRGEIFEFSNIQDEIIGFNVTENEYRLYVKKDDSISEQITMDKNGKIESKMIGLFTNNFKMGLIPVNSKYLIINN